METEFSFHEAPRLFIFQCALNFSVRLAPFDCLALVKLFLSAHYGNLNLNLSAVIIHRDRDNCQTFLALRPRKRRNFFLCQKETPVTHGVVTFRRIIRLPRRNIGMHEEGLPAADCDVCPLKRAAPSAKRLYFKTKKLNTGGELFQNLIVKIGFFVFYQHNTTSITEAAVRIKTRFNSDSFQNPHLML